MNELENQESLEAVEATTEDPVAPDGVSAAGDLSEETVTLDEKPESEEAVEATTEDPVAPDGVSAAGDLSEETVTLDEKPESEEAVEATTEDPVAPDGVSAAGDLSEETVTLDEKPESDVSSMEQVTAESGEDEVTAAVSDADTESSPTPVGIPGVDWYIIHTYSGFEGKVKESLRVRAEAFGFGDCIGEILIPAEDVVEMRKGKKITSRRLLYPGYIVLQLKMDDELWHVVKNTPRVTGFVGGDPSPTPLTADEVNQILYRQTSSQEQPRPKMSFQHNDRVKIVDGPFTNFTGTVEEVNPDRSTLKVMVTIFGRGTPVELGYFQVEAEKI